MTISEQDRKRISVAIRAAEERTVGRDRLCAGADLLRGHGTARSPCCCSRARTAWLLVAWTEMTVQRILLLQITVFLALLMILCVPRVRVALMPRRARRAVAHRVAMEQFTIRGIARTKDRSGVLIFVSLAERYVRIIADEGISARVPQSEWQAVVDALVVHMRGGRIGDGFITAIDICGSKLAEHFPRNEASRHELPDRIYLI
jgi:putative membrane protein